MKISHSACQMYLTCAYMYFLHYFRKLRPIEEKSAFAFGGAVDEGLNTLLETRDLKKALRSYNKEWKKRAYKKKISYAKSDLDEHLVEGFTDEKNKMYVAVRRRGEILIKEFHAQVMPRIKEVKKVQIEESMYNDEGDELVFKTDFICKWEDDRIILFDNKTSTVRYKEDSVRTSPQLAIYYEALKEEYKIDACGYIEIPKKTNKKKLPAINIKVIIDDVDTSTINKTYDDFVQSLEGIKAGKFPQNKANCVTVYGPCPYYNYCHKKSMEGLEEKQEKREKK